MDLDSKEVVKKIEEYRKDEFPVLIKREKRYQAFLSRNAAGDYRLCLHFTNIDLEDY